MEWNELSEKDRMDYIRKGVSLGYRTLEDIQNNFNLFSKGGKKHSASSKEVFIRQLDRALLKEPFFNTPLWRLYFINLAGKESSYKNVTNGIGASGYFQLMPYNRHTGDLFQDMFNLTKRNYLSLLRHLNTKDYKQMNRIGTDIYGLLAGMHLGGGNAIKALRTYGTPRASNAKDANGTSVLGYMRRFSQRSSGMPLLYDNSNEPEVVQNITLLAPTPQVAVTPIYTDDNNRADDSLYLSSDSLHSNESYQPDIEILKISIEDLMPSIKPLGYLLTQPTTTEDNENKNDVIKTILDEPLSVLLDSQEYNNYIHTSALGGKLFLNGGPQKTNAGIKEALQKYPALNNILVVSYADPDYNVGYGSIEYFPKGTLQINYGNENNPQIVLNPNPSLDNILYNPNAYSSQDELNEAIALDMVSHGMHNDSIYDTLNAMLGSFYPSDAVANAVLGYEKEHGIRPSRQSIEQRFNKYKADLLFINDYYTPGVDSIVRGYLFEKDHPDKNDSAYQRLNYYNRAIEELTPEQVGIADLIYHYLLTNKRPLNILPEVIVKPKK